MAIRKSNLWGLLSDSFQVIRYHPLHYLALAALFIFPNTVLAIVYPFLLNYKSPVPPSHGRSLLSVYSPNPQNGFLIQAIYMILTVLFGYSAIASIIYSTNQIYYGRPAKFLSSLKSIPVSFFPLLVTNFGMALIFALVTIGLGLLAFLAYNALSLLGLVIDYDSTLFVVFVSIVLALCFLALIYLQMKWFLADAVVIVEKKWGLQPLKRSSYLVKGMQWVALSTILLFLIPGLGLAFWHYRCIMSAFAGGISKTFVVSMIVYAGVITTLSLYGLVVRAVLLAYCKKLHGEADSVLIYYTQLPGEDEV